MPSFLQLYESPRDSVNPEVNIAHFRTAEFVFGAPVVDSAIDPSPRFRAALAGADERVGTKRG
jgi:hypothetical protein